ncbi:hypothetical protein N7461_004003 [Penicillium sp. DV-2018c]|nr:hypothetical protein N7461_004003 [Penicillium sp. DV-2018c]
MIHILFKVTSNTPTSAILPTNNNVAPVLSSKPTSSPTIAPNGQLGKSSISLEHEVDDATSSDEDTNPFNPDQSASDTEDDVTGSNSSATRRYDRPGASFGSAPHRAPSTDGSSISTDPEMRSATGGTKGNSPQHNIRATSRSFTEIDATRSVSRSKDRKPPPPPKSHHGRRIDSTATAQSPEAARSQSANRLSMHDSFKDATPGASHPSTTSLPATADYFAFPTHDQRATESTDSLRRSNSQPKRPPTPPLSRRHSRMRRSQSSRTQRTSRLSMSYDSESNDSSQPPSPGPSSRHLENKRLSMPPVLSGDFQTTSPLEDVSNQASPTDSRPSSLKAGQRASSYGNPQTGSTGPPPPPPPRRTRDSIARNSDLTGLKENENPSPQPRSNALDILADLTKLQQEVDDLRGHYENRKVR